jgi:hypothetical protein
MRIHNSLCAPHHTFETAEPKTKCTEQKYFSRCFLEKISKFWFVTSYNLMCGHYENGGTMFLYNAGNHLQHLYIVTTGHLSFAQSNQQYIYKQSDRTDNEKQKLSKALHSSLSIFSRNTVACC